MLACINLLELGLLVLGGLGQLDGGDVHVGASLLPPSKHADNIHATPRATFACICEPLGTQCPTHRGIV